MFREQGCTHPNTYEPVVGVLADMIPLLELPVIDPTQSVAFPMTVVALLPYMLLHYEDANQLCVRAACHIAQVSIQYYDKLITDYRLEDEISICHFKFQQKLEHPVSDYF